MSNSHSLLAAHISSLYHPSQVHSISIATAKRQIPLSSSIALANTNDASLHHASHASYYTAREQPSLILRLVNNNTSIELSSATSHIPPVEITFPSPLLPNPTLVPDQYSETHLIVCTKAGSVYRLVFPVPGFWSGGGWEVQEYVVKSVQSETMVGMHVVDASEVLVSLNDGNVLKLKATRQDGRSTFEDWKEHRMSSSTGLVGSFSLFGSRQPGSSDIVSFGSILSPAPTSVSYTLSRDRQLRIWKNACLGSVRVPSTFEQAAESSNSNASSSSSLLPPSQADYIRVLPSAPGQLSQSQRDELDADTGRRVMVFVPTPTGETGGFFVTYELSNEVTDVLVRRESRTLSKRSILLCSRRSAGMELRDFAVVDDMLWCLWDTHGRAMVESTPLDEDDEDEDSEDGSGARTPWSPATYVSEPDYSPAYFDQLLLGTGSFTDVFMGAILRPGIFSKLTLETAISQYRESIIAAMSSATPIPALVASYPTLGERIAGIVGCTVECAVDLQTGEQLWDQYWSALKRDWEGFVARCREIERSARWPIALGVGDNGRVVILERERLGTVVVDDEPLRAAKLVLFGNLPAVAEVGEVALALKVFEIAKVLRENIELKERVHLEQAFSDRGQELLAFSFAEVGSDIARSHLVPFVDANVTDYIVDRVELLEDFEAAVADALNVIRDLERLIKPEVEQMDDEDDVYRNRPSNSSGTTLALPTQDRWEKAQWPKLLTAAYVGTTVAARYELCVSLLILVAFVGEVASATAKPEPSALDRVFETFKSLSILKMLCQRPGLPSGGEATAKAPELVEQQEDDMLSRFKVMRMASVGATYAPPNSSLEGAPINLVHALLLTPHFSPSSTSSSSASAFFNVQNHAHNFLHANALLKSTRHQDVEFVEVAEVRLMDDLRELGLLEAVREVGLWVSEGPGAAYIMAKTWLQLGRIEVAVRLFDVVAGSFGDRALTETPGKTALAEVLPFTDPLDLCRYYQHVAELFEELSFHEYLVKYAKLAIDTNVSGQSTELLWEKLYHGYVALGLYEEAYMTVMATVYPSLQTELVRKLATTMCDQGELNLLTRFSFVGHQAEVERTLAFKARNSTNPTAWPDYSKALYSWYIFRGDYRKAGGTMYLQARQLADFPVAPNQYIDLATIQARCYLAAVNALSLVDPKNAWVPLPAEEDAAPQPSGSGSSRKVHRKRRKLLCSYLTHDDLSKGVGQELEVVELSDIRQEYMLVLARLSLAARYPDHDIGKFLIGPVDIVSRYIQNGAFDEAIGAARSLDVSMTAIFENLTSRCLELSRMRGTDIEQEAPWLLFDGIRSCEGTPVTRAWRYLQESLERNDTVDTDFECRKVVLKRILDEDREFRLPGWLIQFFEQHQPEDLIRMCLKYDLLQEALRHSINLVKRVQWGSRGGDTASREPFKTAAAAWLPYTVFDQLLAITKNNTTSAIVGQRDELRKELDAWMIRARKLGETIRSHR
ncbi:hypothetical protein FRB93_009456 [Tulasnella sp. JGI-2019a]|nr:hypothetical protein FRB93_009456 [Tulasnella sp. JGI-2019a]